MSTPPPLPSDGVPPLPTATKPPVDKEPTVSKAPPKGKLFPCLNCGAKVEFDPRSRALKCPYCGHTSNVEEGGAEVEERDFNEYARKLAKGTVGGIAGRSTQTKCSGCGATVLLEDKVVTDVCPFCGTHLENKPEVVEGMLPPESVIPFAVDLRHARESFEKWLHGLWFAPSELKNVANLGQLVGVYMPYWTYDAMTYTRYRGMRGDNYQETEHYTEKDANGNDVSRTRTVTKTHWYPVSGEVQHFFDDVLVCGSKSIPPHLISGLEPWDTNELEAFQDSFLAGLKTERYAVDLKEGLGGREGDDAADDPQPHPAGHRRRPPAHRDDRHALFGRHVQALPAAGVGRELPVPRETVPTSGERAHGEGVRRAPVELDEDLPPHRDHPAHRGGDFHAGGGVLEQGRRPRPAKPARKESGPRRGSRSCTRRIEFAEATWPCES